MLNGQCSGKIMRIDRGGKGGSFLGGRRSGNVRGSTGVISLKIEPHAKVKLGTLGTLLHASNYLTLASD